MFLWVVALVWKQGMSVPISISDLRGMNGRGGGEIRLTVALLLLHAHGGAGEAALGCYSLPADGEARGRAKSCG